MEKKISGIVDAKGKIHEVNSGDKIIIDVVIKDEIVEREIEVMEIRQKDPDSAKITIYQYKS